MVELKLKRESHKDKIGLSQLDILITTGII